MKKKTDAGDLAVKAELTEKQKAQREVDCAVKYGRSGNYPDVKAKIEGIVQEKHERALDAERKRLWLDRETVEALPPWEPTIQPAVEAELGANSEVVEKFMATVSRSDRQALIRRLAAGTLKSLAKAGITADPGLVEVRVWDTCFTLQKDQGVVLKSEIAKAVAP